MRLQLLPMLSSAAVKAAEDGTPFVQRLDFAFPTEVERASPRLVSFTSKIV